MNMFKEHPFDVLLDYAHNPAAVQAVTDTVDQLDVTGMRRIVLAAPGDRRDEDITAIARAVAGHFEHYICRADDGRRGRGHDEVPQLLRSVLLEAGVPEEQIEVIVEEPAAVDHALRAAEPGDLVVVLGDDTTRCWKQIINFSADGERPDSMGGDGAQRTPHVGIGSLLGEGTFIRDQRGVRVATSSEDD